jgi:Uma2 family endonuclease
MGQLQEMTGRMTLDGYYALEAVALDERHEYVRGEVFAMTGTTDRHNLIAQNFCFALREGLRGGPCQVFMESVKLRLDAADCVYYPDLMVTCSANDAAERLVKREALLVVEVLSESSAAFDRGGKFADYRSLPSLAEYVVVEQDHARVEVFRRGERGEWILHPYGPGEQARLSSLGLDVPVDSIYEGIDLDVAGKARD